MFDHGTFFFSQIILLGSCIQSAPGAVIVTAVSITQRNLALCPMHTPRLPRAVFLATASWSEIIFTEERARRRKKDTFDFQKVMPPNRN